jgi:hypothetical protein
MRMNGHTPAELALSRLATVLRILYGLIEQGNEAAKAWFALTNRENNTYVHASIVRLHLYQDLQQALRTAGLSAGVKLLANNGVRVLVEGTKLGVWKADREGGLPAPGQSRSRCEYYVQPLIPRLLSDDDSLPPKLAVLWHHNANGLLELQLVCPKGFRKFWESAETHWSIHVPHPAQSVTNVTDFSAQHDDLDEILERRKTAGDSNDDS